MSRRGRNAIKKRIADRIDAAAAKTANTPVMSVKRPLEDSIPDTKTSHTGHLVRSGQVLGTSPEWKQVNAIGRLSESRARAGIAKVGPEEEDMPFVGAPGLRVGMTVPELGKLTGVEEEGADPRQVAVQFYIATLKACLEEGMALRVACNKIDAPWPECIGVQSIIHSAAHAFETTREKPFTKKEHDAFDQMLRTYLGRIFFSRLRDARIFQFKEHDFQRAYHLADVSIEAAAGHKWMPFDPNRKTDDKEVAKYCETAVRVGAAMPFPEKLPFRACWLAWGAGTDVSPTQRNQYGLNPNNFHLLMGTLISSEGWVFSVVMEGNRDSVGFAVTRDHRIIGGMKPLVILERIGEHTHTAQEGKIEHDEMIEPGWTLPYDLVPFIVNYTIAAIEKNDSLTQVSRSTLHEKLQYKSLTKRTGQKFTPAPYYTVFIQPTTYTEIEKQIISRKREWTHQWDVIGHWGNKIQRGTLPIAPKVLRSLQKRKYEVYHALRKPTAEVIQVLMDRRLPMMREGEWLAHMKFWRDAFIKGPADKPYIPSVHKLRKGMPEVVNDLPPPAPAKRPKRGS